MAWDPRNAGAPAWTNLSPEAPPEQAAQAFPPWPDVPPAGPPPDAPPMPPVSPVPRAPALPPAQPLGPFHEAYPPHPTPLPPPAHLGATQPQMPVRHSAFVRLLLALRGALGRFLRRLWPSQTAAPDWGPTSLGRSAQLAAFLAYLGWWFTGVIVYFNERENRFVRFHAFQSIVYTGLLSIISVLGYVVASLFNDAYLATHSAVFQTLSRGTAAGVLLGVIFAWFIPLIAAATGYRLRIPYIAPYAERYAQPFAVDTSDIPEQQ